MKALLHLAAIFMLTSTSMLADGPIRHVVHFKFKKSTTPEQIDQVCTAFGELATKINTVETLEWGTNVSPEGLDKGFTHCWILTFRSDKGRDFYLHHPDHQAFGALVKPLLEDVHVVDFVPVKKRKPIRKPDGSYGGQKTS